MPIIPAAAASAVTVLDATAARVAVATWDYES